MTTLVIWEVTVKPEFRQTTEELMLELLPATRNFEGCQGISAYTDQQDQCHQILIEYWDSMAHYERYVAWRKQTGVLPHFLTMCATPPILKSYDLLG